MKAPIRRLVEALDAWLHFLPEASVRCGREHAWLQAAEVREQMRHYAAWVNFWGVSCALSAVALPALVLYLAPVVEQGTEQLPVAVLRFLLCFPAVMLGLKYAGDAFICLAANAVRRFAPGAGCEAPPAVWRFRELRQAYAWYCGVPRYWVRRANRCLFVAALLLVCAACSL